MASIKLNSKGVAEKILEEIIAKYKEKISSYDIEDLSREVQYEEGNLYANRPISRKGGSKYVTIPSEVVSFMGLKMNDTLMFVGRKKLGRVYIEKVGYRLIRE